MTSPTSEARSPTWLLPVSGSLGSLGSDSEIASPSSAWSCEERLRIRPGNVLVFLLVGCAIVMYVELTTKRSAQVASGDSVMLSIADPTTSALSDSSGNVCYTARQGDSCYQAVFWAMHEGIYTNPEWYPGLEPSSTFEDFQTSLLGRWGCRTPCAAPDANGGQCHTAEPGEKCYDHVKWSQNEGIYAHPSWYPGLSTTSTFEEFQAVLATESENECATPCKDSCYTSRSGETCYDAVLWAMHEGIYTYPAWYPKLTVNSSFEDFQQFIHELGGRENCRKPCLALKSSPSSLSTTAPPASGPARKKEEGECYTAKPGDACYQVVFWAMQEGIYSHPEWYPTLSSTSSFEDFQHFLYDVGIEKDCKRPCEQRAGKAVQVPAVSPSSKYGEDCHTATPSEQCYTKVKWAMQDGIFANPSWYPGVDAYSSFESFQEVLAKDPSSGCPLPCKIAYVVSSEVKYRSAEKPLVKGIAYGPSPEMKRGALLPNDDFTAEEAAPMWASWGRGDLRTIHQLGANTIRLYGNDPRVNKRAFLDESLRQGIDVIVGMSDYPYLQAPDSCKKHDFDCFQQIYDSYKQNLLNGLTINNHTAYHPAVKAVIVINEPELKMNHKTGDCKAVVSAFDAMLQAERDLGVVGNPIAFTVAYSIAQKYGTGGIGQMEHLYGCMTRPQHSAQYSPKNDVVKAYSERWVNSYNTPQGVGPQLQLLSQYARSHAWKNANIPLMIGEYHAPNSNQMYDLPAMLNMASDKRYPFFLGFAFFEFQARYDKTGGFGAAYEMRFGLYGLDQKCTMAQMQFFGKSYPVHSITPRSDMEKAVTKAFGGEGVVHGPCVRIGAKAMHDHEIQVA